MIKVNLLKNRGGRAAKTGSADINFDTQFDIQTAAVETSDPKDNIKKIVLALIWAAALITYESYHIGELNSQLANINQERDSLAAEIQLKQPQAEKARALQKEIQDIDARVKSIKQLSKVRLREIKAVDFLQNVIPEKVWVTNLDFGESTLKIEGGAVSDDQLNRFVDSLEGKSYFRNVIVLRSVEAKAKDGTIKSFQVSSSLINTE